MLWLRSLMARLHIIKLQPHEMAELGLAPWGRQLDNTRLESAPTVPTVPTRANLKASISMRVIRANGDIEKIGEV